MVNMKWAQLLSRLTDYTNSCFIDNFGTLRHITLIEKLDNGRIRGVLLLYCEDYLREDNDTEKRAKVRYWKY